MASILRPEASTLQGPSFRDGYPAAMDAYPGSPPPWDIAIDPQDATTNASLQ